MPRRSVALLVVVLAVFCCAGATAGTRATLGPQPCGVRAAPPRAWHHVVWIWLENETYSNVIGSHDAPFLTGLAHACGVSTNYYAITHPSLPNYLAATSGSTWGIDDDDPPSSHPITGRSIFGQVAAAGLTWRSFDESMPTDCAPSSDSLYAVKHNPAAYYVGIRAQCAKWDVPLTQLRVGALPSFAFVTPNICDDMHSCSIGTGDKWMEQFVASLTAGRSYKAGDTVVFVTFDEGNTSSNRVATIVISPSTRRGTVSAVRFDHYSLLSTAEQLLGLPRIRSGATMSRAFNLVR